MLNGSVELLILSLISLSPNQRYKKACLRPAHWAADFEKEPFTERTVLCIMAEATGFEPAIFSSTGSNVDHYTTPPLDRLLRIELRLTGWKPVVLPLDDNRMFYFVYFLID